MFLGPKFVSLAQRCPLNTGVPKETFHCIGFAIFLFPIAVSTHLQGCHQEFKLPVNTTSRWGIKQLRISFGFIFLVFFYESSQGSCS